MILGLRYGRNIRAEELGGRNLLISLQPKRRERGRGKGRKTETERDIETEIQRETEKQRRLCGQHITFKFMISGTGLIQLGATSY